MNLTHYEFLLREHCMQPWMSRLDVPCAKCLGETYVVPAGPNPNAAWVRCDTCDSRELVCACDDDAVPFDAKAAAVRFAGGFKDVPLQ